METSKEPQAFQQFLKSHFPSFTITMKAIKKDLHAYDFLFQTATEVTRCCPSTYTGTSPAFTLELCQKMEKTTTKMAALLFKQLLRAGDRGPRHKHRQAGEGSELDSWYQKQTVTLSYNTS